MKYLSNYLEEKQTELFASLGVFFAFSKKQFDDQKTEGIIYASLGAGLIVPKEKTDQFIEQHEKIVQEAIKQDLKDNGKKRIIRRELFNHECFYTGDITDCIDKLDGYGISTEEIRSEFLEISKNEPHLFD